MIATLEEMGARGSLDATVCIVGAGAAGITLACELDGSGISVLLLEAGSLQQDRARSSDMYGGTAVAPHPAPSEFRRVVFGGSTSIWGGRCVPFDPIDFERRDYIADSGWPIAYEDLARHYPRALDYCDAGRFDFSVGGSLHKGGETLPGLQGGDVVLADRIERYSLPTDFGRRYRDRITRSSNVTSVLGARCTSLNRRAGEGGIASITVRDRAGRSHTVTARVFVLATGGIEAPRLLLSSDPGGPGLGNQFDLLGRYYACHFENVVGRVVADRGRVAFDFEKTVDGIYCRRKLQFSASAQRHHRLLNMAFRLHFPSYADASHGSSVLSTIYLAKSSLIREYRSILQHGSESVDFSPASAHLRNIALGLPQLARFSYQWLFLRVLARRKLPYTLVRNRDGSYPLEFNAEQTPMASSRVTLDTDVDHDGVRRVHVDWRVSPDDVQAACRGFLLLRDHLRTHSTCRLEVDEASLLQAITRSVPLGGHHLGTTRMGASARHGVVDTNCAVFGHANLFVASSAVFPTSSHANPTLTIVALAIRLADHLKSTLAASPAAVAAPAATP